MSNRSIARRVLIWLLAAVPCIGLAAGMYMYFRRSEAKPAAKPVELTASEEAARMIPDLSRIRIDSRHAVEAVEAHLVHGPQVTLEGIVKNTTAKRIDGAELTFQLTDSVGSQLGDVVLTIGPLDPQASTRFRLPVKQTEAEFANVRDVQTR